VVDTELTRVVEPVAGELTTAGAPPSPTIIGQMRELGARIVHVYGLTETYRRCSWDDSRPHPSSPSRNGKPSHRRLSSAERHRNGVTTDTSGP